MPSTKFNVTPYNIDSVYKDGPAKKFMPQIPSGRLSFFMICLSLLLFQTVNQKTDYKNLNYHFETNEK